MSAHQLRCRGAVVGEVEMDVAARKAITEVHRGEYLSVIVSGRGSVDDNFWSAFGVRNLKFGDTNASCMAIAVGGGELAYGQLYRSHET